MVSYVPPSERQVMDIEGLRRTGLLWLINRAAFHPRGLALGAAYKLDDKYEKSFLGFQVVGNGSHPMSFSVEDDNKYFSSVEKLLATYIDPDRR